MALQVDNTISEQIRALQKQVKSLANNSRYGQADRGLIKALTEIHADLNDIAYAVEDLEDDYAFLEAEAAKRR